MSSEFQIVATDKVYVIGIGDDGVDGLTDSARRLLLAAEVVVGDEAALRKLPPGAARHLPLGTSVDDAAAQIAALRSSRVVVLASGDPLFYGMARFLCTKLGKDQIEVVPHVSSMQLAFARVKESWEDAYLTSLASRPLEAVLDKIRIADKVGLFTSDQYTPAVVARSLLAQGIDYFTGYVCENLGSPDERVTHGELAELAGLSYAPLNVMVLVRKPRMPDRPTDQAGGRLFGNPDEAFLQSTPQWGLLTPAEVRAIALAQLDLGPASVVWDIGAGSGSLSIEAARLARDGQVFAIEMDPEEHRLLVANAERFAVPNVRPVLGRAPEAWNSLPDPDAVFLEGSGREIVHLCQQAFARLRGGGRLVANVGSVENLAEVHKTLHRLGPDVRVWMVNVARGNYQLERIRFEPLRPTFLLAVVKPG